MSNLMCFGVELFETDSDAQEIKISTRITDFDFRLKTLFCEKRNLKKNIYIYDFCFTCSI